MNYNYIINQFNTSNCHGTKPTSDIKYSLKVSLLIFSISINAFKSVCVFVCYFYFWRVQFEFAIFTYYYQLK